MTREEFIQQVDAELAKIRDLFATKNKSYGHGDNVHFNFEDTARRLYRDASMPTQFKVLFTLVDKHHVALANRGLEDPECAERLRDIIVYSLLALGMLLELQNSQKAITMPAVCSECVTGK